MIRSMTAYARHELNEVWGSATWELRSVNQRYLELNIRLPEQFRNLEPIIREKIRRHLTRGKIDCSLRVELTSSSQGGFILNEMLAEQLIKTAKKIQQQCQEGTINPIDILRWPGVMSPVEQDLDHISEMILKELNSTLDNLIAGREREGATLAQLLEQRLHAISQQTSFIRSKMPDILHWQREKLLARLAETNIKFEENRLEQEIILLAQRTDIAEELDRLETHVNETFNILRKNEAVGRRLDFMMQELNRESNTITSKSIDAEVTKSAVELKVLIEQMREQIQNIE